MTDLCRGVLCLSRYSASSLQLSYRQDAFATLKAIAATLLKTVAICSAGEGLSSDFEAGRIAGIA